MARTELGLGSISFAPLHNRELCRCSRTGPYRIGPMFQLAAGTLDRSLQKRSGWPTLVSAAIHSAVVLTFLATLPAMGALALPSVSDHIAAFVAPPAPAPPLPSGPLPPPAPKDLAEKPAAPEEPQPPIEKPLLSAAPVGASTGITGKTGLVASVPVSSDWGIEGGVGWGQPGGVLFGLSTKPVPPSPTPESAPTEPIRVGGSIPTPTLTCRVEPEYPAIAVRARLEGIVVLEATVDREGRPQTLTVLRSCGVVLDRAARQAVQQWRYEPLVYRGRPHPFVLTVMVSFSIDHSLG